MKTTKSIIVGLFVLLAAQVASAYYCPSTGRWLSRDPMGEPGFQALQTAAQASILLPASDRWINRDPIGELGFMFPTNGRQPITQTDYNAEQYRDEITPYTFAGNAPIGNIDYYGLLKFQGCSPETQATAEAAFKSYCENAKSSAFKCCVGHFNVPDRLASMCGHSSDITIKCQPAGKGFCKGACAYSFPGGSTIHLCGDAFKNPGCIAPGCILLHEMTHMSGHGFEK